MHNTTDQVVHGTALIFATDYGFASPKQFSNCFYAGDELNACTFDQELQPGVTYQAAVPYQMRPDTYAPSNQAGEFEWLTAGDYDDLIKFLGDNGYEGPGQAGSGDKLTLQALPSKSDARQAEADRPEPREQLAGPSRSTVTGKQGTDLAAIGATVSGAAGDTVTANIGVRNNGPATVDRSRAGEAAAMAVITIPDGTKVTGAPDELRQVRRRLAEDAEGAGQGPVRLLQRLRVPGEDDHDVAVQAQDHHGHRRTRPAGSR